MLSLSTCRLWLKEAEQATYKILPKQTCDNLSNRLNTSINDCKHSFEPHYPFLAEEIQL